MRYPDVRSKYALVHSGFCCEPGMLMHREAESSARFDKNRYFYLPVEEKYSSINIRRRDIFMWYWIVMFILIAGSIGMLGVSFKSIKKNKAMAAAQSGRERRRRQRAHDDEDEEEYELPQRRRRRPEPEEAEEPPRHHRKKRRQWKIILEDIDSWDKYSFTFYDTVGIGRGKDGSLYEKYLPITGDGRVSKIHCAIIHRGDKLYLKDEGSRNGTYLNGERIDRPVMVQRDDIIGVGETRLEIQRILRESE